MWLLSVSTNYVDNWSKSYLSSKVWVHERKSIISHSHKWYKICIDTYLYERNSICLSNRFSICMSETLIWENTMNLSVCKCHHQSIYNRIKFELKDGDKYTKWKKRNKPKKKTRKFLQHHKLDYSVLLCLNLRQTKHFQVARQKILNLAIHYTISNYITWHIYKISIQEMYH